MRARAVWARDVHELRPRDRQGSDPDRGARRGSPSHGDALLALRVRGVARARDDARGGHGRASPEALLRELVVTAEPAIGTKVLEADAPFQRYLSTPPT